MAADRTITVGVDTPAIRAAMQAAIRDLREAYASALSRRAQAPGTPEEHRAGLAQASVLIRDGEL
jgi:hypothetical protein